MTTKPCLHITTAIAAALTAGACSSGGDTTQYADRDTAICVDQAGARVPDGNCDRGRSGGGSSAFLWYYLGRSAAIPYYGERPTGGSYARSANVAYSRAPATTAVTRSAAVARGGFGSSAHAFGSAHA